jgi:hypothetical protein
VHVNHDKVQFIGHAVNTGARRDPQGGWRYAGLLDDAEDMAQRLQLVGTVLAAAALHRAVRHDATTVKVLVLPEFFFRGAQGPYSLGVALDTLVPGLRRLVRGLQWQDWLFCFGTLMGYRADAAGTVITNCSLLQCGGFCADETLARAGSHAVLKEFLCRVDFLSQERTPGRPLVVPLDHRGLPWNARLHDVPAGDACRAIQGSSRLGYATFDAFGLAWGVEICADQITCRLAGAPRLPRLDFHLVPSCGSHRAGEAPATRHGWVFSVEGLGAPASTLSPVPAVPGRAAACTNVPIHHPGADRLFARGAGTLNIFEPVAVTRR